MHYTLRTHIHSARTEDLRENFKALSRRPIACVCISNKWVGTTEAEIVLLSPLTRSGPAGQVLDRCMSKHAKRLWHAVLPFISFLSNFVSSSFLVVVIF